MANGAAEGWRAETGLFATVRDGNLALAVSVPVGEDKDVTAGAVVEQLRGIAQVVVALKADERAVEPE